LMERAGFWPGRDAWFEIGRAWASAHPDSGSYYDDGRVRTVFTIAYRLLAVDLDEPRIIEGLRLTSELLAPVRARLQRAGAQLLLLLIPTKERVFADALRARGSITDAHRRLIRNEDSCRGALLRAAELARVEVVDLLGPLESAIASSQQVYPTNIESHPNAAGYYVIARTIADRMEETRHFRCLGSARTEMGAGRRPHSAARAGEWPRTSGCGWPWKRPSRVEVPPSRPHIPDTASGRGSSPGPRRP
jgi:hypothetical protein